MRIALALCLLLFAPLAAAQTTHPVIVRGLEFIPASLEIRPGDTVEWTNEGGFHNVAERTPGSMPEGFGNDPAGAGWTYSFTFDELGDYLYLCGVHPTSMLGEVLVRSGVGNEDAPLPEGALRLSAPAPNPAVQATRFDVVSGSSGTATVTAYDLLGRAVAVLWDGPLVAGQVLQLTLDAGTLRLPPGAYFVRAESGAARAMRSVVIAGQ